MAKITNFLLRHKKMYYFAILLRFSRNATFRDRVIAINENPREMSVEKRGDFNKGMLVYDIDPVIKQAGFFAVFRRMLTGLYFAEEIGAKPYVHYSDDFLYAENKTINGTTDPFEYYFMPIKAVASEKIDKANAVVKFEPKHIRLAENLNGVRGASYRVTEQYLQTMAEILQQYVHLNPVMGKYISNSVKELGLSDKTIAVHCRGTDFNIGSKEHPVIVTAEDYFIIVDELIAKGKYTKVFLATDDLTCLKKFIDHYGDILCYFSDVERTDGNEGVHFSKNNRVNHHYLLGAEVVRDAYTMAACGGLVAGMSEVSICTRIINRGLEKKYIDEIILDKGIVLQGRRFSHKEKN